MALHQSGEDYLEAILLLQKEKEMVGSVDVARHMGVANPGFLVMDEDRFLHLTDVGRDVAEKTYEKHCFFTHLLIDAGVEPKTAEQDACRMEHAISDNSFQKMKEGLQNK